MLVFLPPQYVFSASLDTTLLLPEVEITETVKNRLPEQNFIVNSAYINQFHVLAPKDISVYIPNVYLPAYGSAMTSSMYVRGLGSRVDEPVMSVVVDDIPLMDKNMFDFHLQNIGRIELKMGPQANFYGRNTLGGIMQVYTQMPLDVVDKHLHVMTGYSSANSIESAVAFSYNLKNRLGISLATRYDRTDGFYTNCFNGQKVDYGQDISCRLIVDYRTLTHWRLTNTLSLNYLNQGAFPYAAVASHKIDYNDKGAYRRMALVEGFKAVREGDRYKWNITASFQQLNDEMLMDNDYTADSIFTLKQKQKTLGTNLNVFVESKLNISWYQFQCGVSTFTKYGNIDAPVTFLHDGIEDLILFNANKGIRQAFPEDSLEILENQFVISNDFRRLNLNAALYHQSVFMLTDKLTLRLALRWDVEYVKLRYNSNTSLNYRMTAFMQQFKPLNSGLEGQLSQIFHQVLPKFSLQYDFQSASVYAYAAKGSKVGGFNTQIFSTITQNRIMDDMMSAMGVHFDDLSDERYTSAEISQYKPEKAWTFEVGLHYQHKTALKLDADAFYTVVKDMQLTVFPKGNTSGRMMTNAAKAFSVGGETKLSYRWNNRQFAGIHTAAYGFAHAKFLQYDDGVSDYRHNHIPYAPQHTLAFSNQLNYKVEKKWLNEISMHIDWRWLGRIWWNEKNDISQPFYATLNMSIELRWQYIHLLLWSKNLLDTKYDVFYFVSMNKSFLQHGQPRQLGVQCSFEL